MADNDTAAYLPFMETEKVARLAKWMGVKVAGGGLDYKARLVAATVDALRNQATPSPRPSRAPARRRSERAAP